VPKLRCRNFDDRPRAHQSPEVMPVFVQRMLRTAPGGASPHPPWRRGMLGLFLALLMLPVLAYSAPLAADVEVRVALLFNFMRFAEWPNGALGPEGAPVNVCIAPGDTEMQRAVSVLEQRSIGERPITTRQIATPREVGACHVLYLPDGLPGRLSNFTDAAQPGPILTVSNGAGFVDDGGMIGLKLAAERYQFEVNNEAVRRAGLRLPPQLLSLASRVR